MQQHIVDFFTTKWDLSINCQTVGVIFTKQESLDYDDEPVYYHWRSTHYAGYADAQVRNKNSKIQGRSLVINVILHTTRNC